MSTTINTQKESNVGFVIVIIILTIIALGATALAIYFIVVISDPTKYNQKNIKKTMKNQGKQSKK